MGGSNKFSRLFPPINSTHPSPCSNNSSLRDLVRLDVSNNSFGSFSSSLDWDWNWPFASSLVNLDLSYNSIPVPCVIGDPRQSYSLTELRLSGLGLTWSMDHLLQCVILLVRTLQILDLSQNRISMTPTIWNTEFQLEEIDLSYNQINGDAAKLQLPTLNRPILSNNFGLVGAITNTQARLQQLSIVNTSMHSIDTDSTGRYIIPASTGLSIDNALPERLDIYNITCPTIVGGPDQTIQIDHSYLYYQHCNCTTNHVVIVGSHICVTCPDHLICGASVFRPIM